MNYSNADGSSIENMASEIVIINGRKYDKYTGMPLDESSEKATRSNHATNLHSRLNRSKTLDRRYVKRRTDPKKEAVPETETDASPVAPSKSTAETAPPVHKIARFAKSPRTGKNIDGIGPVAHPIVKSVQAQKTIAAQPTAAKKVHKPSDVIKSEAIDEALAKAPSHHRERHKEPKSSTNNRRSRITALATAGTALLLLVGYFSYLNMPNLSVRVAAARAGIDATYPSYRPSGYSISGPVSYDEGKVRMKFNSNGSSQSFVLAQESSNWNSSTVLEKYVEPKAGENYSVTSEGGLTIYAWKGNAAWTSGGILYTVTGDGNISPDQIRHMAVSM